MDEAQTPSEIPEKKPAPPYTKLHKKKKLPFCRRVALEIVKHPDLTREQQAANLGVSRKTLQVSLNEQSTQDRIKELMDKAGATDEEIAKVLAAGLHANKTDEADHAERRQTAKLISEMKGTLSQKVEITGNTFNLSQIIATIRDERKKRGLPE